jgi:hypothetical protein
MPSVAAGPRRKSLEPTPREMARGMQLDYDQIPETLTFPEASELLGITHQAISQAFRQKKLITYEIPGWNGNRGVPRYFVYRDDLIRWAYLRGTIGGRWRPIPGSGGERHFLTPERRRNFELSLLLGQEGTGSDAQESALWLEETSDPDYRERLLAGLAKRKMSQSQLARLSGVTQQHFNAVLNRSFYSIPRPIWETARALGLVEEKRKGKHRS